MIDKLFISLYDVARSGEKLSTKDAVRDGHAFEDIATHRVYELSRELGLKPNPQRHTLNLATVSGNHYQFDVSFTLEKVVYIIECKKRKLTSSEHIYYFNAKLLDHQLATKAADTSQIRGIFLSSAQVEDGAKAYAIAYGIIVIDPESPSIEQMIATTREGSPLHDELSRLRDKINDNRICFQSTQGSETAPKTLLQQYKFLLNRWRRYHG